MNRISRLLLLLLAGLLVSACAGISEVVKDADNDGVRDADDRCIATVRGAQVDRYGCADSDGDGIIDGVDRCPNTPPKSVVDHYGCMDSDNDGVKNGEDHCPRTAMGERVMRNGCSARQTVNLESVRFAHGRVDVLPEARERLFRVADLLIHSPEFRIALQGHSDNSGSLDFNYRLSNMRAKAVKAVLLALGVAAHRIDIQAYGDAMPIADNSSEEGRARNRRVALRVIRVDSVQ
ncbi:Alpha-agarase [Zhongshania aliphaticivorans]|uniref:Alpha-agarase n=1 Tax=Zhongshania aliphaticivorans TaxID=1470434 RepID=A0A5S9PM02_9GAMM|nr:OmpA family protein [Zhongshania aliphaticivorans]CAA0105437.1 Alpha-agarase [Zhongshania aliphaticivorans]CAA0105765.1 Alpha-agarase [Zhongshania aliphaticivorans]